jgi:hypothetical protein
LRRVSLAHPGHARFNDAPGFGSKKEAHGLALGKGGPELQTQAMRGEVSGISEVFSVVTLDHKRDNHFDPLTLRPTFI